MLHQTRKNLQKCAVIAMGSLALIMSPGQAKAAEEGSAGPCAWCRTECPGSLTTYCRDVKGCPWLGATCSNATGCQGGSGEWYTYTVECKDN